MAQHTAICPEGYKKLADITVGKPRGLTYHEVHVVVSLSDAEVYHVHMVESEGDLQGHRDNEDRSRLEVIGRGTTIHLAIAEAGGFADDARMHKSYLAQAMSQALAAAEMCEEAELLARVAAPGGHKIGVHLTEAASDELSKITESTGLSVGDIFRQSLSLFWKNHQESSKEE